MPVNDLISVNSLEAESENIMTELSASDAAYSLRDQSTSTYADNGIGYSCFIYFNI